MDRTRLTLPALLDEAVRDVPDRLLITGRGADMTYAEVNSRAVQAARLWQHLGVRKGDRVAFMLDNSPAFLVAWFGLAKIGAVLVAVNTRFRATEAAHLIGHSGANVVLTDDARGDTVAEIQREHALVETVLTAGTDSRFRSFWAELDDQPETSLDAAVDGDSLVSLIYTSGTTGLPKAVMQTHSNFVLTGQAYVSWLQMRSDDRIYVCLPLSHINSQAYAVMGTIAARATMVLAPRFSASQFWSDVRRYEVTMFNFIGAMLMILSRGEPTPDDADNSVRVAYSGSVASLTLDERRRLEERYGITLRTGFGMSETTFGFIEPYDATPREGSIGRPRQHPDPSLPVSEARIVRDDGSEASTGETGELLLRNATMMAGYYNDPQRTREALRDGWLRTGDYVYTDKEGFYYFVDRKKDIIRRRGENVSSLEVERALNAHPGVKEATVVGVPSHMLDEDILAYVVPESAELAAEELWSWVGEQLADFKVPRFIEFIDDLPKTGTQKIAKSELRELAKMSAGIRHDHESFRR